MVAQQELGRGLRQGGQESVIFFLERVQEVFSQAYGPLVSWSAYHRTKLVESVVKGVSSKKLADLVATYQISVPFFFVHFRDIVIQFAQRVPQITQEKAVGNQAILQMIVCSRGSRPLVTAVTKWGILLPSVEPGTSTVLSAKIRDT